MWASGSQFDLFGLYSPSYTAAHVIVWASTQWFAQCLLCIIYSVISTCGHLGSSAPMDRKPSRSLALPLICPEAAHVLPLQPWGNLVLARLHHLDKELYIKSNGTSDKVQSTLTCKIATPDIIRPQSSSWYWWLWTALQVWNLRCDQSEVLLLYLMLLLLQQLPDQSTWRWGQTQAGSEGGKEEEE